jgi:Tfp pilus assembly protein PilW
MNVINPYAYAVAGGPVRVAHTGKGGTANGVTSDAIDTTAANFLVICAGGSGTRTISDSLGNTWTALTARVGSFGNSTRIHYCYSPTTGGAHTFSVAGTGTYPSIFVLAFSGVAASPFDVESGGGASTPWTTVAPGAATPSQANSLAITSIYGASFGSTPTINGGYTVSDYTPGSGGNSYAGAAAWQVLTASSAQNPTWTAPSSQAEGAAALAIFKW